MRTDRQDGIIYADVVVLAEGVNGLLGTRAGLRERPKPDQVALTVKEMHCLPREAIEARLNLKGDQGVVIEAVGNISRGMTVVGFIYANRESISLGIGCLEFQRTGETAYELLDRFKRHPSIVPLIAGSNIRDTPHTSFPKAATTAYLGSMARAGWLPGCRPAQRHHRSQSRERFNDLRENCCGSDLPREVARRSHEMG